MTLAKRPPRPATIFKIATDVAWAEACRTGQFKGSDADRRDGFIHLSAAHQLAETARRHFSGQEGLVLIAVDARALSGALKWEASRGGELFPHVYGPLPASAAIWTQPLALGPDGAPLIPDGLDR
jgi:uncharacterized protein (DUF952 family)